MQAGASIINTTSITAYRGHKTLIDYASTKGAIVAFTRSLSQALTEKGIRVNGVAPGPIWTPLIPASFDAEKVAEHGAERADGARRPAKRSRTLLRVSRQRRRLVHERAGAAPERRQHRERVKRVMPKSGYRFSGTITRQR